MLSARQGLVLYDGPSAFDGTPILAIVNGFLNRSVNKKTGPMLQVFIVCKDDLPSSSWTSGKHRSVCNDCKHGSEFGNSCYVNLGHGVNMVWKSWKNDKYIPYVPWDERSEEDRQILLSFFDKEIVRFGAFGDPAAVPYKVWEPIVKRLRETGGKWTGYTHSWKVCDIQFRDVLMASVDSPTELGVAQEAGWRTFRTMLQHEAPTKGEFYCPATDEVWLARGKRTTCHECCACNGLDGKSVRRGSVVIKVHGLDWKVQNYISVRGKEVALEVA